MQRRGHRLLNDWPADGAQVAAHRALQLRRVDLDLVAHAAGNGILVAFGATRGIEQRAQPRFRRELGGEDDAAAVEEPAFVSFEARQRPAEAVAAGFPEQTSRGELPLAGGCEDHQHGDQKKRAP